MVIDVNGQNVAIDVQQGKQTFKWLALVLQTRLQGIQAKSRGPPVLGQGSRVIGLTNMADELLDPRDCIYEHAHWDADNCWELKAQTSASFESDQWGNPVYNDWTSVAYLTSENNFRFQLEMDAWRARLEPGQTAAPGGKVGSNLIQIGEAPDEQTAFELDWSAMHWKWLPSLTSEVQKAALRSAMAERYSVVLALFRHFCGAGELGQRYGMTLTEFSHLVQLSLRLAPVEDLGEEEASVHSVAASLRSGGSVHALPSHPSASESKAAAASTPGKVDTGGAKAEGKDGDAADASAMPTEDVAAARREVESMARAAYEKTAPVAVVKPQPEQHNHEQNKRTLEIEEPYSPGKAMSAAQGKSKYNRNKGEATWLLLSRAHMCQALVSLAVDLEMGGTVLEAVTNLLDGPLTWLLEHYTRKYNTYRHGDDETFATALANTYFVLKQAFLTFGSTDPTRGPTMSASEAKWLFKNSLFVGSSLLDKDIEAGIVRSMEESQLRGQSAGLQLEEMVFSEFLETLTTLALVSDSDSGLEVGKKVRLAFNTMVQLQPLPDDSRADDSADSKK